MGSRLEEARMTGQLPRYDPDVMKKPPQALHFFR
jgi:hypothetical protein